MIEMIGDETGVYEGYVNMTDDTCFITLPLSQASCPHELVNVIVLVEYDILEVGIGERGNSFIWRLQSQLCVWWGR
jgi:hypothetical protein